MILRGNAHVPLALLLVLACGVDSADHVGRVDAPGTADTAQRAGDAAQDVVTVELEVPAQAAQGSRVPMMLRVANTGRDSVVLGLTGRPTAFDFVVAAEDGTEVWSRLHDETVSMILELRPLAPGEVLEFTHEWNQQDNDRRDVAPGVYYVHGILPAEDRDLRSERRRLVISDS